MESPLSDTAEAITPTTARVSPSSYQLQHHLLDRCVIGDWHGASVDSLCRYFRQDGPARERFSGRHFDRFAGGGDAAGCQDQVTAADILALNFLSIKDRLGAFAIDVLEVHREAIAKLLSAVPADVAMHEAPWTPYELGSAGHQLWELLCTCGGKHMWVYANKLLARKRPHLVPVYDRDVRKLLLQPDSYWACLWSWFAGDQDRVAAVTELRADVGGIEDISLLRCLDVVLWMRATGRTVGA